MRIPLIVLLLLSALALNSCMPTVNPEKVAEVNEAVLQKEGIAALKVGDKAPEFTADTVTGERVQLPTNRLVHEEGEEHYVNPNLGKWIVLYFYPADFTPNSSKHLLDLSKGLDELTAQGVKVYGITSGTADTHRAYMEKQGITVPLLADTGVVAKSYGALLEGGKYPQRTLVGIKPDGTIGFYRRGFGHLPIVKLILGETGKTPAPAK